MDAIETQIERLRVQIEQHRKNYYAEDRPEISDYAYDTLYRELEDLEKEYPQYDSPNSPTKRVGGVALEKFQKIAHTVPMKSLQDVFSYEELRQFIEKIPHYQDLTYTVECKIDGLSVCLVYDNGKLIQGATRGDGIIGEDVTQNLRTVRTIPLTIDPTAGHLEVRGEIYMPRESFFQLNEERKEKEEALFANPRNAAAGSLRQLDSKIAASRKLDLFLFNVQRSDHPFTNHDESLQYLAHLGFPIVPFLKTVSTVEEMLAQIEFIGSQRGQFPFEIDGVVIKVNSLSEREQIGEMTNAPKWAVAYKFPPEQKETKLLDIVIQVGRTGVLTPNAVLEPVRLAGTTVSRATLHNIDFIQKKGIRIGDSVLVQKAGDIIPEIVEVNVAKRTGTEQVYTMPTLCPSCGEPTVRDNANAAVYCTNTACPAQLTRNLIHFASRNAMDIDGFGRATAKLLQEKLCIVTAADLYKLKVEDIKDLDRMQAKSATNLIQAIEKSKQRGLERLIYALGIRQVGEKAAKAIAETYLDMERLFQATLDNLTEINDIGAITAQNIVDYFAHPHNRQMIGELRENGVCMTDEPHHAGRRLEGKTFVLTGTLPTMTREEASAIITKQGGKISSSVSKNTSYVLVGEDAGKKLSKAQELNIEIINEEKLIEMVK